LNIESSNGGNEVQFIFGRLNCMEPLAQPAVQKTCAVFLFKIYLGGDSPAFP